MPTNPDILGLIQTGKALVNPTSAVNQQANSQITSILGSVKENLGIAGESTTSNDPNSQVTARGKIAALNNEASAPRASMTTAEVQENLDLRNRLIERYQKELSSINDGSGAGIDGFESPNVDGTTTVYDSTARQTYLNTRISQLQSERDTYQAMVNSGSTSRPGGYAIQDRLAWEDDVRDRERTAAGVQNLADQLGTMQAHTDTLLGDSTRISGLGAAQNAARKIAGAATNCGDVLGAVGSLTGTTDIINGALGVLSDAGEVLGDINKVLIQANAAKAQLEELINTDIATADEILQAAKDGAVAAVLSEVQRDPCAQFLFTEVLGSPDLRKILG